MRLFVAINLQETTRRGLVSLQEGLRRVSAGGRFTTPENLHLTLAFLGECDPAQAVAVRGVMDEVRFAPFPIEIHRLGCFRRAGGDIWWAGVRESEPLLALQRDLADGLRAAGFSLETRAYTPHITLAREVRTGAGEKTVPPFGETVMKIDLMQSERIRGKLSYTAIHTLRHI